MYIKKMELKEISKRKHPPGPWEEGDKIPWNDPAFSERMLKKHLSQEHDWASRRLCVVDQHLDWIEAHFLKPASRILDLGCGPGLYTHRLAGRGHDCVGLDFSPASIAHAKAQAETNGLPVRYHLADVRQAAFGKGFDLVMMIFGEFNVFRETEAKNILNQAWSCLKEGGSILIEGHSFKEVKRQGLEPPTWEATQSGVFADHPYLQLEEHFWHADCSASTTRYLVIGLDDGATTHYASTMKAYTDKQYELMLAKAGFSTIRRFQNMGESATPFKGKLHPFTGGKKL
jgi:cyclopropane fatty-acyl-phospholipid synthase-like methyltransferase